MSIKKIFNKTIVFCFLLCSFHLIAVENSIIKTIEEVEQIENLPTVKYSKNQFNEIKSSLEKKEEKIRLLSYNVLFNLYDHNLEEVNRWPQRLPRIMALIEEMQPDIIGVQELYPDQAKDLLPLIDNTYSFYSRTEDNEELNGIFYRKDRFDVIDSKILYMSDTPDIPSSKTLTLIHLKDLKTGKELTVFNTHLTLGKIESREFQARFIADHIEPYATQTPIILTGDLNSFPNRPDLKNLPFYDGDYIHRILTQGSLKDAKDVSILGHVGPTSTFSNSPENGIPFKGTGTPGVFLDHIYVSKGITVLIHAVQPGTIDGHFPSDHLPLIIDFTLDD